ncbi:hypothetical protein Nepgr_018143 [Nepenthes gracilis]|uniref:Uncharacterized protein n=1 Tax=Nepenthes gracilis TaxID=150966 RepID=A0AAD3XST8_NEPGR|nr:hypothetical protein Nepgr_018143 [Nepenthes gracilis]
MISGIPVGLKPSSTPAGIDDIWLSSRIEALQIFLSCMKHSRFQHNAFYLSENYQSQLFGNFHSHQPDQLFLGNFHSQLSEIFHSCPDARSQFHTRVFSYSKSSPVPVPTQPFCPNWQFLSQPTSTQLQSEDHVSPDFLPLSRSPAFALTGLQNFPRKASRIYLSQLPPKLSRDLSDFQRSLRCLARPTLDILFTLESLFILETMSLRRRPCLFGHFVRSGDRITLKT